MRKMFKSLSNFQIEDYYRNNPYFKGCFAKDVLPQTIEQGFYILNLDNQAGAGTHWTLIINLPIMPVCFYYDPFGVVPPMEALKFMKTSKRKMYYSTIDMQHIDSSLCGYYCIYVADQMLQGRKFLNIAAKDFLNNTGTNDNIIRKHFKYIKF